MKLNPNDMHAAAEQATGCAGARSYIDFAESQGYKFLEVLDWSSSAGDWAFIVSKDGKEWHVLTQTNNYPKPGFSHSIGDEVFVGTAEEVFEEINILYY